MQSDECSTVAQELFNLLLPYRESDGLEVEIRLGRFTNSGVTTSKVPVEQSIHIAKGKIEAGVSRADASLIAAYCESIGESLSRTEVRDVVKGSCRYTYTTDTEAPRCIACVRKKRFFVRDIAVPCAAYSLRFSVSKEIPQRLPSPDTHVCNGFERRKERQSVKSGLYCYDTTCVRHSKNVSYEVEIEGVFTDPKEQLTVAWVNGLLERAVAIARLPLQDKESGLD